MLTGMAQVTKGEATPQFRILFYAIYTILVTQRGGGMAHPLNTPLTLSYSEYLASTWRTKQTRKASNLSEIKQ